MAQDIQILSKRYIKIPGNRGLFCVDFRNNAIYAFSVILMSCYYLADYICPSDSLLFFVFNSDQLYVRSPLDQLQNRMEMSVAKCGKQCEVYSRIVGYFAPTAKWNFGKREEFKARKTFVLTQIEKGTEHK